MRLGRVESSELGVASEKNDSVDGVAMPSPHVNNHQPTTKTPESIHKKRFNQSMIKEVYEPKSKRNCLSDTAQMLTTLSKHIFILHPYTGRLVAALPSVLLNNAMTSCLTVQKRTVLIWGPLPSHHIMKHFINFDIIQQHLADITIDKMGTDAYHRYINQRDVWQTLNRKSGIMDLPVNWMFDPVVDHQYGHPHQQDSNSSTLVAENIVKRDHVTAIHDWKVFAQCLEGDVSFSLLAIDPPAPGERVKCDTLISHACEITIAHLYTSPREWMRATEYDFAIFKSHQERKQHHSKPNNRKQNDPKHNNTHTTHPQTHPQPPSKKMNASPSHPFSSPTSSMSKSMTSMQPASASTSSSLSSPLPSSQPIQSLHQPFTTPRAQSSISLNTLKPTNNNVNNINNSNMNKNNDNHNTTSIHPKLQKINLNPLMDSHATNSSSSSQAPPITSPLVKKKQVNQVLNHARSEHVQINGLSREKMMNHEDTTSTLNHPQNQNNPGKLLSSPGLDETNHCYISSSNSTSSTNFVNHPYSPTYSHDTINTLMEERYPTQMIPPYHANPTNEPLYDMEHSHTYPYGHYVSTDHVFTDTFDQQERHNTRHHTTLQSHDDHSNETQSYVSSASNQQSHHDNLNHDIDASETMCMEYNDHEYSNDHNTLHDFNTANMGLSEHVAELPIVNDDEDLGDHYHHHATYVIHSPTVTLDTSPKLKSPRALLHSPQSRKSRSKRR